MFPGSDAAENSKRIIDHAGWPPGAPVPAPPWRSEPPPGAAALGVGRPGLSATLRDVDARHSGLMHEARGGSRGRGAVGAPAFCSSAVRGWRGRLRPVRCGWSVRVMFGGAGGSRGPAIGGGVRAWGLSSWIVPYLRTKFSTKFSMLSIQGRTASKVICVVELL